MLYASINDLQIPFSILFKSLILIILRCIRSGLRPKKLKYRQEGALFTGWSWQENLAFLWRKESERVVSARSNNNESGSAAGHAAAAKSPVRSPMRSHRPPFCCGRSKATLVFPYIALCTLHVSYFYLVSKVVAMLISKPFYVTTAACHRRLGSNRNLSLKLTSLLKPLRSSPEHLFSCPLT